MLKYRNHLHVINNILTLNISVVITKTTAPVSVYQYTLERIGAHFQVLLQHCSTPVPWEGITVT